MVLGTSSHAGKTMVAAALCRSLFRKGFRVAPFKAQNMSNNSWVTPEGAEIGRAQAMQARAAGIEPHADMNPILLKPMGGNLMQVVAMGKAVGNLSGKEYYRRKDEMRATVREAYDRLAGRFQAVILEGAGSPAEINLREEDLVNGSMAEYAGARCILVADIERGGVFASIFGTISLLEARHRALLAGVVINKFRGDASLLDSGIREIESLTGVPVLGVLPYLEDLGLEEEDSLGAMGSRGMADAGPVRIDIAVIRLPFMSNFTDFQPFLDPEARRTGVRLRYVAKAEDIGNPDFLILPGSKNVRHDADFLRGSRLDKVLEAAASRGIPILGICGGYQILGRIIRDPHGIEGEPGETAGLGLLPVDTTLEREKELCRVEAENLGFPFLAIGAPITGYEIHMGRTVAFGEGRPLLRTMRKNGAMASELGGFGSVSAEAVFGCYLHGLFDLPEARAGLFRWVSDRKGLDWPEPEAFAPDRAAESGPGRDPLERIADLIDSRFDAASIL
ncbi:MAG: threonine-phosphate decarboxylase [Fibrobacteres bacterium]|nr:threonine-phosphate decarboxylase [Fibrobacterota bacterium]